MKADFDFDFDPETTVAQCYPEPYIIELGHLLPNKEALDDMLSEIPNKST